MGEIRKAKMRITASGGNSGKNTKSYRVSIPNTWASAMDITPENRDISLDFDGEKIIIKKIQKNA